MFVFYSLEWYRAINFWLIQRRGPFEFENVWKYFERYLFIIFENIFTNFDKIWGLNNQTVAPSINLFVVVTVPVVLTWILDMTKTLIFNEPFGALCYIRLLKFWVPKVKWHKSWEFYFPSTFLLSNKDRVTPFFIDEASFKNFYRLVSKLPF